MSVGQFLAISSVAFVCGLSVLFGFSLSAINHYFLKGKNNRPAEVLWIASMCLGMSASTLAPLFAFIVLVNGDDSNAGLFWLRAVVFFLFLGLGMLATFVSAHLFNKAVRSHQE